MILSCDVIQDLLPLYHDGVCSGESAQLVRDHLVQCITCSKILESLKGEMDMSYTVANEVKPLEEIKKSIRKGKRRAVGKGMLAAVAILLVLALLSSCIWYLNIGRYYDKIADKMEPITKQMSFLTSATHYLEAGMYGVILQKPIVFSDAGFIRVGDWNRTVGFLKGEYYAVSAYEQSVFVDLFFYPPKGGDCKFAISFEAREKDILDWVWVNPDLSPDMEAEFYNLEEQQQYAELLEEYRPEIEALFALVEEQFGISYLE